MSASSLFSSDSAAAQNDSLTRVARPQAVATMHLLVKGAPQVSTTFSHFFV